MNAHSNLWVKLQIGLLCFRVAIACSELLSPADDLKWFYFGSLTDYPKLIENCTLVRVNLVSSALRTIFKHSIGMNNAENGLCHCFRSCFELKISVSGDFKLGPIRSLVRVNFYQRHNTFQLVKAQVKVYFPADLRWFLYSPFTDYLKFVRKCFEK